MMERQFKGVWIPAEIWLDTRLTLVEKALYAEIDSFSGVGKSFHKTNDTIQLEYGISRPTVSKSIKTLESLGFIESRFDGRMRHLTVQADRKIFTGRGKDSFGQPERNLRAAGKNSTSKNTIERTTKNTSKESGTRPKDLEVVLEAFREVGAGEDDAMAFFDYYEANGWTQGRNKPIKDWKAAARGWIRRTAQFKPNAKQNRTGPSDGSLIAEHLRKLAAQSGESLA
jgi:DNA-binding transcriptional ArsR family regulator